jgi:hypothetical protein
MAQRPRDALAKVQDSPACPLTLDEWIPYLALDRAGHFCGRSELPPWKWPEFAKHPKLVGVPARGHALRPGLEPLLAPREGRRTAPARLPNGIVPTHLEQRSSYPRIKR